MKEDYWPSGVIGPVTVEYLGESHEVAHGRAVAELERIFLDDPWVVISESTKETDKLAGTEQTLHAVRVTAQFDKPE